ncbi:hypothetical protein [Bacillus xiapuensis]|uniref:Uncharacterized protein n=1 Tax=Bacillus xiapuensis TaxID=2014075 RepID=A0ABU6NDC5_9BACI|nr:hypothetical protein [Bacillus xiapuensis]
MQFSEGARLRKERKDKDEKCLHGTIEKEYYNDMATGDYVCTFCGEQRWTKAGFEQD